ncbi:hypothetical protein ABXN37_22005 [Piscinibacter sakaiensis]|nr:hypothetical protein [Piscinibacter sakaiensis]
MNRSLSALMMAVAALAACGGNDGDTPVAAAPVPAPAPAASAPATAKDPLSYIDETKMITSAEAKEWLVTKDNYGPAYAGSAKYDAYIAFLEKKMREYGLVDFTRYTFPYSFWETTEWPDKSGWSLTSDGTKVDVASYATNSGNTGTAGVTGQMIVYDPTLPAAQRPTAAQMKGKIVVIKHPAYATQSTPGTGNSLSDYEYRSDPETFAQVGEIMPLNKDADFRNRTQLSTATTYGINVCQAAGGLAAIWVLDMSPLAAQGARQHGTPRHYNCPGVLLDRNAGQKVLADAAAGKTATVTLNATVKDTRPAQLIAYLPGKNYGKANDQKLLMVTHTEGQSNVEDNGSLGIMGVLHYYAKIPQAQRPRTIMVYLDNRHFVAGAESAYPFDYMEDFPDAAQGLVGGLAMEHFGGVQFNEVGDDYKGTGWPAHTSVYTFPNQLATETAISIVKEVKQQRANVAAPPATGLGSVYSKPGVNGKSQGFWYGPGFMSAFVEHGRLPAFHVTGDWPSAGYQAYYPSVGVRVDPEYFRTNVRTSLRLLQTLSTEDLTKYAPDWGIVRANIAALTAANFQTGIAADAARTELLAQFDAIFTLVRNGDYANASLQLPALRTKLQSQVVAEAASNPLANIDRVIALAKKGANLPS